MLDISSFPTVETPGGSFRVSVTCTECQHFWRPAHWPDVKRESSCVHLKVSLSVELGKSGYVNGLYFCKSFASNQEVNAEVLVAFQALSLEMSDDVLYLMPDVDSRYAKEINVSGLEVCHHVGR